MKPDLRDAHIYGGCVVMAVGLGIYQPWLGVAALGGILAYLGIFRMG